MTSWLLVRTHARTLWGPVLILCGGYLHVDLPRVVHLTSNPASPLPYVVLEATLAKTGVQPAEVGDVVVGSVLGNSSQRANEARIGLFLAGFPDTVPVRTVNRQCSSGLQAVADVAAGIKSGYYDIGIAAGVETMSRNPMKVTLAGWPRVCVGDRVRCGGRCARGRSNRNFNRQTVQQV